MRAQTWEGQMINRAQIRGTKLDEDCKHANTTTEADLCVCYGLIDNAENFLPKCKKCKALVWNAEELIVKRMEKVKQ